MKSNLRLQLPINVTALLALANSQCEAVMHPHPSAKPIPKNIKVAMDKLSKERESEVQDAAAVQILDLLQRKDEYLIDAAEKLIILKRQVEDIKGLFSKVQTANSYGIETKNFLPLAKLIGVGVPPLIKEELVTVPKDWKPTPFKPSLRSRSKKKVSQLLKWMLGKLG